MFSNYLDIYHFIFYFLLFQNFSIGCLSFPISNFLNFQSKTSVFKETEFGKTSKQTSAMALKLVVYELTFFNSCMCRIKLNHDLSRWIKITVN